VQNESTSAPAAIAFANANFPLTMISPAQLSIKAACYFLDSEKAVTVAQQKRGINFAALPLIA
jgi:hypothetical protein